MSLEAQRSRLRELECAARKLATSAECAGTSKPELIQLALRFHPAEGASAAEAASIVTRARRRAGRASPAPADA
jgi:hypothetical protein